MKNRQLRTVLFLMLACSVYLFLIVPLVQGITTPSEIILTSSEYATMADTSEDQPIGNDTEAEKYITVKVLGFLPVKKVLVNILPFDTVLVGGTPLGIYGQIDGLLVTADSDDHILQKGDVIKTVDGVAVRDLTDFNAVVTTKAPVTVTMVRNGKLVTRQMNTNANLDLRDTTTGVGMLTLINPENNTFSALGHQMADFETGAAVDLCGGEIRPVQTYGIIRTQGRQTGIIQSSLRPNAARQGSITQGNNFGITGCLMPDSEILAQATTTMPVATRYNVKPGKAALRTSLDGVTVEEFACEILKTRYQNRRNDKSMVIRVTDPRLLEQTGGIVHGMSGSPIIQDGHVVGALTHAITHDPAKGYAVYIDFIAI